MRKREIKDCYALRKLKSVEFSKQENSLLAFFFQLMRYLQQSIGTVAAIDLNEYYRAINFSIDEEI